MINVEYKMSPKVSDQDLNILFATAWQNYQPCTFSKRLKHSLLYICAFDNHSLIGFVNVAWDGGIHGFILDTTVHANYQREGIGVNLIRQAALAAKARGIEWLHVDYEPHLTNFYKRCGFFPTEAGLLDLTRYCI